MSNNICKNYLVIGDWFVDEYWFVVRHYSDVSSHTGPFHYRIVSESNDPVKDLCGAGLIARILYELRKYQIKPDELKIIINKIIRSIEETKLNNNNTIEDKQVVQLREIAKQIESKSILESNLKSSPIFDIKKIINHHNLQIQINVERIDYINKEFNLFGLGCWNEKDEDLLGHFAHAHCQPDGVALQATSSLFPKTCEQMVDAKFKTLEPDYATTRCIRTYSYVGGSIKQLHRIDWEQRPKKIIKKIPDSFWPTTSFDAVIVEDHKKGVIDIELINEIKKKAPDISCRWFVRTKNNRIRKADMEEWPDWLKAIETVELLVVGPEIACRSYPISGLLTDKGHLAEHAYSLVNTLIDRKIKKEYTNRRIKNVALTSDKFEVVVLLGDFCFIAQPPSGIKNIELIKINWTTAFFTALVYEMLTVVDWDVDWNNFHEEDADWCERRKDYLDKCRSMIKQAINNSYKHSGVKPPKILQIPIGQGRCEAFLDEVTDSNIPKTELRMAGEWSDIRKNWHEAKTGKGIIEFNNKKRLDIWRASTDLPGYIACIQEKREAIQRIWQKVDIFTLRKDVEHSLCILLEADPAVGKSYLARMLANNIPNCKLVPHDITQMIERAELLDLFDTVATAQAQSSGPVFVFVDEINATLGGSPVYGAFLSPLEAGNYMRDGQRIELKPCIWMFAGTPKNSCLNEKREDFESRMTLIERIDYSSIKMKPSDQRNEADIDHEARLEQVYLGAQMINNVFNDVKEIDLDVLEVFATLPPEKAPARLIKRLAASLENVQYGRVHKGNCTSLEWQIIIQDKISSEDRNKWTMEFQASENVIWVELGLK